MLDGMRLPIPFRVQCDAVSRANLIFALAGRESRKEYALELYAQGVAPSLLMSVARFEIRRFAGLALPKRVNLRSMAAPVAPPERHFFVCFEGDRVTIEKIFRGRWGTLSEIRALRLWLEPRPEIRHIAVISSRTHLPRVRLCCKELLDRRIRCDFVAVPKERALSSRDASAEDEGGPAFVQKEI
jgi:hypothetical protein